MEAKNQAGDGEAERMHRPRMNMVRCMLFSSALPLKFWGLAAQYAVYVLNRMPTKDNPHRKSPLVMLEQKTLGANPRSKCLNKRHYIHIEPDAC